MLGHRSLELADYTYILKRRRWLILSCALIFPAFSVFITRFIPPRYMSQTLVLIEQPKVPGEYVQPIIDTNLDARLASMKEQILSRSRIQPIVDKFELYTGGKGASMDERIEQTRKNIDIKPIRSTISGAAGLPGFFIDFTASDAHTAQLVCAEITNLFINANAQDRASITDETSDFLKTQLDEAKHTLDDQDAKMKEFEQKYFGKLPAEEGANMSMLNSLNSELDATTQQLTQLEQQKAYGETLLASAMAQQASIAGARAAKDKENGLAPGSGPVDEMKEHDLKVLQNREIDLLTQYTANHPDVVTTRRQIADLKREIAASAAASGGDKTSAATKDAVLDSQGVQNLKAQLHTQDLIIEDKKHEQAQIKARLNVFQERVQSSPEVEEAYKSLTRDFGIAQKNYDELLNKMNRAKMAGALEHRQEGETFRIMDESNLPDSPSFPKVSLFAMGGLALGLALSLGIAAFLEYKDTSLRSERDVWAFTRLPTLGVISIAGEMPGDPQPQHGRGHRFFARLLSVLPQRLRPAAFRSSNTLADARG